MSRKVETLKVENISIMEVKTGQTIQLENDNKFYVVMVHGQNYELIPIDLKNRITVNKYSINKPKITHLFNKNGECLKVVKVQDNE